MTTAGTLVINLLLNTAGVSSGLASVEAQLKAFEAQATGATAAARAAAAAATVSRAQDAVTLSAQRQAVAQGRLLVAQDALAISSSKVAAIKASQTATADAVAAAELREARANVAVESSQAAVLASTIALKDAQASLAVAQNLAANPPIVKNASFPLVTAAAALASFFILKFGDDSVKVAAEFEYQMRLIQTQANASEHEVKTMGEAILGLAGTVQAGPVELSKALFHIESVGYRGAKALDILKSSAQGAAVGNADLESVTNALVAAVATGIRGTENFAEAMGVLNATVGVGNLRMQDLAASLSSGVLSTAKQFGLSLLDVGAALATMADQGIPAEEAATRLRITIALLGAPTKLATAQLEKIGLTQRSIADAMRGPDGLYGALALLKGALDKTFGSDEVGKSQVLKTAFGGSRSSSGILLLINSLTLLQKKNEQIENGKNTFGERFAEEASTAEAQFRNLSATLEVLAIRVGGGILPVSRILANVLAFLADKTLVVGSAFGALTLIVGAWAAISTGKLIKGMTLTVIEFIKGRVEAYRLATGQTAAAAAAQNLAAAQANLAGAQANLASAQAAANAQQARGAAAMGAAGGAASAMGANVAAAGTATAGAASSMSAAAGAASSMGGSVSAAGAAAAGAAASMSAGGGAASSMGAGMASAGSSAFILIDGLAGADAAIAGTAAEMVQLVILLGEGQAAMAAASMSTAPLIAGLLEAGAATGTLIAGLLEAGASTGPFIAGLLTAGDTTEVIVAHLVEATEATDVFIAGLLEAGPSTAPFIAGLLTAGESTQPLIAGLLGTGQAMEATVGASGGLAAGLSGVDSALADTAASTAPVVAGLEGIEAAQASVAGTTEPVVAGLEAEAAAASVAAEELDLVAAAEARLAEASAAMAAAAAAAGGGVGILTRALGALSLPLLLLSTAFILWQSNAERVGQGVRVLAFHIVNAFSTLLNLAAKAPFIGGAFTGIAAEVQKARDGIVSEMGKAENDINNAGLQMEEDVSNAIGHGFGAGLVQGDQIKQAAESAVEFYGTSLAGVEAASENEGAAAMRDFAKGILDAQDAPVQALKDLQAQLKNPLTQTIEIARLVGELSSKALADGLASQNSATVASAVALKKTAIERLNDITGGAYSAGAEAGYTWQQAFLANMAAAGLDTATAQARLNDILANPAAVAEAQRSFSDLGNVWRNQFAPSAQAATKAYGDLLNQISDTTSIPDQAAAIIKSIGDNPEALKTLGRTAGSDLMGAIAKGIEERRNQPLDALKELHKLMQDQFDKNREISLLWAERQSKDIRDGLKNKDPEIVAQTQYTVDLITARLDELTDGAYSRAQKGGAAVGAGMASAQGAVTAGAVTATSGVPAVVDALTPAGAAGGMSAAQAVATALAAYKPYVTAGAAQSVSGAVALFDGIKTVFSMAGIQWGANVAGGLASQGDNITAAGASALNPLIAFLTKLGGIFKNIGTMIGQFLGGGIVKGIGQVMTGTENNLGKMKDDLVVPAVGPTSATKSWEDFLKGTTDMSKYLQDALNGVTHSAAQARSDMTSAFADIKASAEEYFQKLHDGALQAIHDAHDQKNAILDAKEALNQAPVTAAQKALDFQRKAIQEWRLRQAVANATDPASRRDAILALQDFLAQKHIDAMQTEVDNAKDSIEAQKKKNDELEKQQVAAENRRYELQKKNFDRELAALQRFLANHPAQWRKAQNDVIALLGRYGITYHTAGAALGSQFASGLRSQVKAAYDAARAIAAAGAGVPPSQLPPPPPSVPPPSAPVSAPPVNTPSNPTNPNTGKTGPPVPFAIGAWSILEDNLLALLHQGEMVVPPGLAELLRSVGSRPSPWRGRGPIGAPGLVGSPALGRAEVLGGDGGGGPLGGRTINVYVGQEKLAEITDRSLAFQTDIYSRPRVTTSSRR